MTEAWKASFFIEKRSAFVCSAGVLVYFSQLVYFSVFTTSNRTNLIRSFFRCEESAVRYAPGGIDAVWENIVAVHEQLRMP